MVGVQADLVNGICVEEGEFFDFCEEVCEHHDRLAIVPPGHGGGACGIAGAGGSVVASEEVVGSHGEEDVLVPAAAEEEHAAGGVEAEHGVLALEVFDGHLQIHLEAEVMICPEVWKERGEAETVADGEVVVYHGGPSVHANLTCAHFEAEVVVDNDVVAGGEEGDDVVVLPVVYFLEPG